MSQDPIAEFENEVVSFMQRGTSRRDAVKAVRRKNPELTKQYLLATNPGRRQQREIEERFDDLAMK